MQTGAAAIVWAIVGDEVDSFAHEASKTNGHSYSVLGPTVASFRRRMRPQELGGGPCRQSRFVAALRRRVASLLLGARRSLRPKRFRRTCRLAARGLALAPRGHSTRPGAVARDVTAGEMVDSGNHRSLCIWLFSVLGPRTTSDSSVLGDFGVPRRLSEVCERSA